MSFFSGFVDGLMVPNPQDSCFSGKDFGIEAATFLVPAYPG
jgi:hypothetical protein